MAEKIRVPLVEPMKKPVMVETDHTLETLQNSNAATCRGAHGDGDTMFKVHISEVLGRTVVIFADNKEEAYETAEELCNAGIIALDGNDFGSRTVEVLSSAGIEDVETYENYEKELE